MAQALYKWTGDLTQPESWDSSFEPPQWYGSDADGNGYAYLDTGYAALCSSSNDDLAATTSTADKDWVKANSPQAKEMDANCVAEIRASYSIDDELKAHRTSDTATLTAIGDIVSGWAAKKNALVGD